MSGNNFQLSVTMAYLLNLVFMKKYVKLFFILVLLFHGFKSTSQENPAFNDIVGKLARYSSKQAPEKTYIQTDKDYYITGETIWYKVFLVNGITHDVTEKSNVVYLELLNEAGEILIKQKLFVQDFGANGAIELAENLEQGNYTLRAYTKYMLNEEEVVFHSKEISIRVPEITNFVQSNTRIQEDLEKTNTEIQEKPLVLFYPEGGNLVSGIPSILGIKITDSKGNGIALQGKIIDEENHIVSLFESYEFGLGKGNFTPDNNKKHYASILVNGKEEKYPLPNVKQNGYTLSAQNFEKYVVLNVASNIENGLDGTMLIGHIRGRTIYKHIGKTKDLKYSLKLLTNKIEDGIAHFTLFTSAGEPVCERLVFIDNPDNDVTLSAKTNSKSYASRGKVSVDLEIQSKKDYSLKGNFTVSVVTSTNQIKDNSNIKSWLLLNSDIGATFPNANYFFEEKTKKKKHLLDLLMLTHGWRRFIWKDILDRKVSKSLSFEPEKGIMIKGKTTSFENKYQPKSSQVSFSTLEKDIYQSSKTTNSKGEFTFGPFIFQDTIMAIIQAEPNKKSKNARENELAIYIEDDFPKLTFEKVTKSSTKTINFDFPKDYLEQAYKRKVEDFKYDPKATQISEVVINAQKKKTRKERVDEAISNLTLYGDADNRIFKDSLVGGSVLSALDMVRNVAGVQVYGTYPDQTVIIRGITSINGSIAPLFLLDGNPVDSITINQLTANEIVFVDVLKGPITAMYGSRGSNGVIAFYTYGPTGIDEVKEERSPDVTNFKIKGFSKTREFFSPNYSIAKPKHDRADYRTTLHWLPNIEISDSNSSNFSFYTGDVPGTYIIKIEGITFDGQPVNTMQSFMVE